MQPQVRTIMKRIQEVKPDEYATRVRALLREDERIVAVVDETFQGVITRKDVMVITSSKSNVKARDIMSLPLLTAGLDEEVHTVGRKMMEKDVYSVPVTENSRVLGVVHMEDIIQAVRKPSSLKVKDIMTTDVVSCDHTEEITRVWASMEVQDFTGLPVTEDVSTSHRRYKKLVGFVTRKDLLRSGGIRPGEQQFIHPPAVEKAMTRTPRYVRPDDPVDVCVDLFKKHNIGRLPVVKDGFELIGIVDRADVLKIYV